MGMRPKQQSGGAQPDIAGDEAHRRVSARATRCASCCSRRAQPQGAAAAASPQRVVHVVKVGVGVVAVPVQNVVPHLRCAASMPLRCASSDSSPSPASCCAILGRLRPKGHRAIPRSTPIHPHPSSFPPSQPSLPAHLHVIAREVGGRVADGVELVPQHALGPAQAMRHCKQGGELPSERGRRVAEGAATGPAARGCTCIAAHVFKRQTTPALCCTGCAEWRALSSGQGVQGASASCKAKLHALAARWRPKLPRSHSPGRGADDLSRQWHLDG